MTPEQEKHLTDIQAWINVSLDAKYRKGQAEHGGNLWERNPVQDMEGEVTDLVSYFHGIKTRDEVLVHEIEFARQLIAKAMVGKTLPQAENEYAALTCLGNCLKLLKKDNNATGTNNT